MCLEAISEKIANPTSMVQSGWKRFGGTATKPTFEAFHLKGKNEVPLDKWLTADTTRVRSSDSQYYEAGFHIFYDEQEVKRGGATVRRVYYRNAHTHGRDRSMATVIAAEMYVPSDPDAWPPKVA